MNKFKIRVLFFIPFLFLALLTNVVESRDNIITRQNQEDNDCSVSVEVTDRRLGDQIRLKIIIPKDDIRLKRLIKADFIIGINTLEKPSQLIVPIKITKTKEGAKVFEIIVGKKLLPNSYIAFTCHHKDLKLSSLDGCYLNIASYIDKRFLD